MEIVGHFGPLHLKDTWFEISELILEAKNSLLGTFVSLLVVHKSLRKWAYGVFVVLHQGGEY